MTRAGAGEEIGAEAEGSAEGAVGMLDKRRSLRMGRTGETVTRLWGKVNVKSEASLMRNMSAHACAGMNMRNGMGQVRGNYWIGGRGARGRPRCESGKG